MNFWFKFWQPDTHTHTRTWSNGVITSMLFDRGEVDWRKIRVPSPPHMSHSIGWGVWCHRVDYPIKEQPSTQTAVQPRLTHSELQARQLSKPVGIPNGQQENISSCAGHSTRCLSPAWRGESFLTLFFSPEMIKVCLEQESWTWTPLKCNTQSSSHHYLHRAKELKALFGSLLQKSDHSTTSQSKKNDKPKLVSHSDPLVKPLRWI